MANAYGPARLNLENRHNPRRRQVSAVAGWLLFLSSWARAAGQTADTVGEFWPAVDVHTQLKSGMRVLAFGGLEKGADYPYQQLFAGVGLGYQLHRIARPHLVNIDPDKEHQLSFAGGYEYLRTIQSGEAKYEDRLALQATLHQRLGPSFLISDRNRVEFRWVNGSYSTRYRNQLTLERDFIVRGFRFTPYAEAEVYYDGGKQSWNEEQYTAGIQWPYKKLLMLNTYYLRQHCTTCNPKYLDVGGVTLNFYFRSDK